MPLPTIDEMGRARGMDMTQKDYTRHYHAFLNPWREMPVKVRELSGDEERSPATKSAWRCGRTSSRTARSTAVPRSAWVSLLATI
jgi:hypothetical protein